MPRLALLPSIASVCLLAVLAAVSTTGCKSDKSGSEDSKNESTAGASGDQAGADSTGAEPEQPKGAEAAKVETRATPSKLPDDTGEHQGEHMWSLSMGGNARDTARDLAVGPDGSVATAGYFSTTARIGASELQATPSDDPKKKDELDGFVAVFDASGKPKWTRQFGGKGDQIAKAVTIDKDGNVIVTGWFGYGLSIGDDQVTPAGADDIFVAKFAPDGRRLWAKRFGGRNTDAGDAIAVDPAGNIYVTGVFRETADFGGSKLESKGNADVYLLKLNPAGEVVYVEGYGDRYDDFGRSVAVDAAGNVVLFGEFAGKVSFGGEPLEGVANRDLFLVKLDQSGAHQWSKSMGGEFDEIGLAVAIDPAGNAIITGVFDDQLSLGGDSLEARGKGDAYVAKYGPDGSHLWSKKFGGTDKDTGADVAADSYGNIFLTGWFYAPIDLGGGPLKSKGKKDAFLVKLSPQGAHLWSKSFGGAENDAGRTLAAGPDGTVTTSGTFRYKLSVGGDELPYAKEEGTFVPYRDIYLARYSR